MLVAPPPVTITSEAAAGSVLSTNTGSKPLADPLSAPGVAVAPALGSAVGPSQPSPAGSVASTGGSELGKRFNSLWQEVEDIQCPLVDSSGAYTHPADDVNWQGSARDVLDKQHEN